MVTAASGLESHVKISLQLLRYPGGGLLDDLGHKFHPCSQQMSSCPGSGGTIVPDLQPVATAGKFSIPGSESTWLQASQTSDTNLDIRHSCQER
jgi:hypothetical protein